MASQQDINININSKLNDKGFNDLNKSIEKVGKSTQGLQKGFGNLQAALVGGLAGGFATVVAQMIPFTINAIKVGASLNNLRAGFAGTAKDMELLRKATAGTVGEAGLIALSNQATDLGLSMENQAKLFSLAEDAGDKYGGSLEENFQKIVNATDGSARGLRAVGISTKEYEQKVNELVKTTGVKLDQMTAEEQLQIRLQAIFELTGTTLETVNSKTVDAADALEQLGLTAETVASNFGSGLVEGFMEAGKAANDFGISLEDIGVIAKGIGEDVGNFIGKVVNDLKWLVKESGSLLKDFFEATLTEELKQQRRVDLRLEALANQSIEENQFGPFATDEQIRQAQRKQRDLTRPKTTLPGSGTSKQNKETEKAKELLTAIDEMVKKIAEKREIESLYLSRNLENTQAYFELLTEIVKLETERTRLMGGPQIGDLEAATVPRTPIEEVKFFPSVDTEGALQEERNKAIEDGKTVYNNIANIMNLLGLEANSFVSTLISGFNTVLAIMESIKAVNTILSFIPGLATGGSVTAGMPYIVGERGAELFMPNQNGQIINNRDTMKILSQSASMQNNIVNVYVGGALDGQTFLKKNFPSYESMRNYKRIN